MNLEEIDTELLALATEITERKQAETAAAQALLDAKVAVEATDTTHGMTTSLQDALMVLLRREQAYDTAAAELAGAHRRAAALCRIRATLSRGGGNEKTREAEAEVSR